VGSIEVTVILAGKKTKFYMMEKTATTFIAEKEKGEKKKERILALRRFTKGKWTYSIK